MSKQPLIGKRIVVTRSREQAPAFCRRLEQTGAIPLVVPAITFEPLPAARLTELLNQLDRFDWLIFTSGNAVRFFFDRVPHALPLPPIAAIGSATSAKLAALSKRPAFVPDQFIAEQLVSGLGDVTDKHILLPRARIGRPQIVTLLQQAGAIVEEIALYDTVQSEPPREALVQLRQGFDVVTFTSPSSVRNFLGILEANDLPGLLLAQSVAACIGPVTADEARDLGLKNLLVAAEYTIDGLIKALVRFYGVQQQQKL